MGKVLANVGGILMLASSVPHALLGWPASADKLLASGVDPDLVAGLAVGWYFGSAAMLAMGGVVLLAAISYRSFNPPLFSFAVIGALLLLSSVMARGAPDQAQ